MRGKTHAIVGAGIAFPFAVAAFHGSPIIPGGLEVAGIVAALGPDVDSPRSKLGRYFHVPLPHRGPTHWLLTAAAMGVLAYLGIHLLDAAYAATFGLVVASCWASHTLADTTNREPVALLPGIRWCFPRPFGAREGGLLSLVEEWATTIGMVLLALHFLILRLLP